MKVRVQVRLLLVEADVKVQCADAELVRSVDDRVCGIRFHGLSGQARGIVDGVAHYLESGGRLRRTSRYVEVLELREMGGGISPSRVRDVTDPGPQSVARSGGQSRRVIPSSARRPAYRISACATRRPNAYSPNSHPEDPQ
jgi:hypothetical protein